MIESFSVRKSAKKLGVNLKTAFLWRHRFLKAAHSQESKHFSGIVEVEDTFFRKSQKGSKKIKKSTKKSEITVPEKDSFKEFVSVLIVCDRSGAEADFITGLGAVGKSWLNRSLTQYLSEDCVVVSKCNSSFDSFCNEHSIKYKTAKKSDGKFKTRVYHIENVTSYNSQLRQWLKPFHGVATKYLNHYLWIQHQP